MRLRRAERSIQEAVQEKPSAPTSGNGIGDLSLALTAITPGVSEGWICLSAATSNPISTGPFIGLHPDASTWFGLFLPAAPGNPFSLVG